MTAGMAEVVIVGAGIIGTAIAVELLARGQRVTLLERAVPGAESSSAAAGMLAPQLEAHAADSSFALGLHSRTLYRSFTERLEEITGIHVAHHVDGALALAPGTEDLDRLATNTAWQAGLGLRQERLDPGALRDLSSALRPDLPGALFYPDEGQVDPRALMRALAFAAAKLGARIISGRTVKKIATRGGRVEGVELVDGHVIADVVVVAAGAWTSLVPGAIESRTAIEPVRGQMLSLLAKERPFAPLLFTPSGYLVARADGRVLVGATVERTGFEKGLTAIGLHRLLDTALSWVPGLAPAPILETWSGLRPGTPDGAPLLGETRARGLFLASGHYRNGVLQAPATAAAIADLVTGASPAIDLSPYDPSRFDH
jgi:glycine oxidase